jgi:hypothetical protein
VCDHETSWYEEAIARAGLQTQRNKQQDKYSKELTELDRIIIICIVHVEFRRMQSASSRTYLVCIRSPNMQSRDAFNRLATFQKPAVLARGKSEKVSLMFVPCIA